MTMRQSGIAVFAAFALLVGTASAAELLDLRAYPPVAIGDAQAGAAKAVTCQACHGPEGRSLVGVFPSLAGQNASYIYLQLQQFKDGRRKNDAMAPFVTPLTEDDMRNLATYFAAQTARPATPVATADDAGRKLYASGDPAQGLPPCAGCHGANGTGVKPAGPHDRVPWHSFPTLAGQQGDYIVQQLQAFKSGSRDGTTHAAIMQGVVHDMDDTAMRSVAAYVAGTLPTQ